MSRVRALAVAAVVAVTVAATSAGAAGAATNGVGTGKASTTVLGLKLGDGSLLDVRVLGDDSVSTIDPKVGTSSAFARLTPFSVASKDVSALNVASPTVEARQPGGSASATVPSTLNVPTVASSVLSGSFVPSSLTAAFDATSGAKAGVLSALNNLKVANGGLAAIDAANSGLNSNAAADNAGGVRGLNIPSVNVLDLGALLKGLGIDITKLSTTTLSGLVSQLNLPAPAGVTVPSGSSLSAVVTQLGSTISGLQSLIPAGSTPSTPVTVPSGVDPAALSGTVGSLLGTPQTPLSSSSTVSDVTAQLAPVQNLLGSIVSALDATSLLSVKDIQVGLTSKAADTVQNSVATVAAKVGSVSVGGLNLPGVDLSSAVNQVSTLVNGTTAKLQQVLTTVSPGLSNLLSVKVLDQAKDVSASGGYTHALAGLTALSVSITPPSNLQSIVSAVNTGTLLNGVGGLSLPGSSGAGALGSSLGVPNTAGGNKLSVQQVPTLGALASGATLTVGAMSTNGDFAVAGGSTAKPTASTPTSGTLAVTGREMAPLLGIGVLFLIAAIGVGRWLRTERTTP